MKDKFNKYCAEMMGHYLDWDNAQCNGGLPSYRSKSGKRKLYNPHDDLNQMADVVDDLSLLTKYNDEFDDMIKSICEPEITVKQAFRDFIISTMPEDKNNDRNY